MEGKSRRQVAELYSARGLLPIPLSAKTKRPVRKHTPGIRSDGTFTKPRWDRAAAWQFADNWDSCRPDGSPKYDVGILLDKNTVAGRVPFVVDFDTEQLFKTFESEFPEQLKQAGLAKTSKGYHVWFWRSEYADERGIYDNYRLMVGEDHAGDIKTITKSRRTWTDTVSGESGEHVTPGNIAVFPSANKTWIRMPDPEAAQEVDDHIVDWVCKLAKAKKRAGRGPPRVRVPDIVDAPEVSVVDLGPWSPNAALDDACLRAMGFDPTNSSSYVREFTDIPEAATTYAKGCYQFPADPAMATCPICSKAGHEKNQFFVLYTPAGERRIFNFSAICLRGGRRLEWTAAGRAAWGPSLEGTAMASFLAKPAEAPRSLPLDAWLYAPALNAMAPPGVAWVVGNGFAPTKGALAGDPGTVGMIAIKQGAWGDKKESDVQAIVRSDGRVVVMDSATRRMRNLSVEAQRLLDEALGGWFRRMFPDYQPGADGVYELPACPGVCGNSVEMLSKEDCKRMARKHAACCTKTSMPWTMVPQLAVHRGLRRSKET